MGLGIAVGMADGSGILVAVADELNGLLERVGEEAKTVVCRGIDAILVPGF